MEQKIINLSLTEQEFVFLANASFNVTIAGKDAGFVADLQKKLIAKAQEEEIAAKEVKTEG